MIRRSDIMITSTLSFNLFPQDKRQIQKIEFSKFDQQEINDFIVEKKAFLSLVKEHSYKEKKIPEKRKDFKESYAKSMFMSSKFETMTLRQFKYRVENLNTNVIIGATKPREIIELEKSKHE